MWKNGEPISSRGRASTIPLTSPIFPVDSHLLPNSEQKPRHFARFSMKRKYFLLTVMKVFFKNQIIDEHINQLESLLTKTASASFSIFRAKTLSDSLKYDVGAGEVVQWVQPFHTNVRNWDQILTTYQCYSSGYLPSHCFFSKMSGGDMRIPRSSQGQLACCVQNSNR